MSKNKHDKNKVESNTFVTAASHAVLGMLGAAAVLTATEANHLFPHHSVSHASGQHVASEKPAHTENGAGEHMRRAMEETRHMTHSYGALMRSHPTAGSL